MHVVNLIECIRGVVVALMFNSCAVRKSRGLHLTVV
jgi:hypothetical protein